MNSQLYSGKKPFSMLAKPSGPICNIDCSYCFYLDKTSIYPNKTKFVMDDSVLENYVKQYIESQPYETKEVIFGWQGGEPTLMGIKFFEKAVKYQKKFYRTGMRVNNAIQTNGININSKWGDFLYNNEFRVGISIDGPEDLHDSYRLSKKGEGTFLNVMKSIEIFHKYNVEFNTLTAVHSKNSHKPTIVYNFLKDIGSTFMQFIPIVEYINTRNKKDILDGYIYPNENNSISKDYAINQRSVKPVKWGIFLNSIFNEWVHKDIGNIFIRDFEMLLGLVIGLKSTTCVNSETCGGAPALEHNGDVYSCDHFVQNKHLLGNIITNSLSKLMNNIKQRDFGNNKRDSLPKFCLDCNYLNYCWGGCPKDRIYTTKHQEKGLNYLCEGYKLFYSHTEPYQKKIENCIRQGNNAKDWNNIQRKISKNKIGRNNICSCGSGEKFKNCCGSRNSNAFKYI